MDANETPSSLAGLLSMMRVVIKDRNEPGARRFLDQTIPNVGFASWDVLKNRPTILEKITPPMVF